VSEQTATRLGVEGIPILRTIPGSPAARAGLRGVDTRAGTLGDIIVSANGKPVRRLFDLTTELDEIGVGHDVKLAVFSQTIERIGAANQRELLCSNDFSRLTEIPDADGMYAKAVRV
jgi:S1-C subfamily serine protease